MINDPLIWMLGMTGSTCIALLVYTLNTERRIHKLDKGIETALGEAEKIRAEFSDKLKALTDSQDRKANQTDKKINRCEKEIGKLHTEVDYILSTDERERATTDAVVESLKAQMKGRTNRGR